MSWLQVAVSVTRWRLGTRVVGVRLLECSLLVDALQHVQFPAQGMVKGLAVALKEVMEVDLMLAMVTDDEYLFHLGLLYQGLRRDRPHITTISRSCKVRGRTGDQVNRVIGHF